jgi:endonuclease YncB( thermonuclease family)
MESKKNVLWVSLAGLAIAVLCFICLGSGLLAGGLHWLSNRNPATLAAELPTLTGTLAGRRSTATLTPLSTSTRSRTRTPTPDLTTTGILSITQTLEADLLTQTLIPLTTTVTISSTQFPIEPSSTVAPALNPWCVPLNTSYQNAQVLRVIDGVSIEISINDEIYTVRYIGIDLTDSQVNSAAWLSALHRNQELVDGRMVLLARDRSEKDEQDRLLRYVIADGIFVNRAMVESGYAVAQSVPPDVSCDLVLQQANALAQAAQRGVWGPTPTPTRTPLPPTRTLAATGNVHIAYIKYWGVGWQDPNEFVEIRNDSTWPIQLQGWTLNDLQGHVFTFPSFVFEPGTYCRIYTHKLAPGMCNFSFYHPAGIWDDDGDCAFLKDALGNLVDQLCYE